MVDIEADGPIPGDYSMISFGAIIVEKHLNKTFFARLKPISENYIESALNITGYKRTQTFSFEEPEKVMLEFESWIELNSKGRPIFISDNNGFDWMFICWYFYHFLKRNPFGHSSQNLGSLYKGLVSDTVQNFKHLKVTKHTHNPVDDAKGNAEVLLKMKEMGLYIKLI